MHQTCTDLVTSNAHQCYLTYATQGTETGHEEFSHVQGLTPVRQDSTLESQTGLVTASTTRRSRVEQLTPCLSKSQRSSRCLTLMMNHVRESKGHTPSSLEVVVAVGVNAAGGDGRRRWLASSSTSSGR